MKSALLKTAVVATCLLIGEAEATLAKALTNTLTASRVSCDEAQLERLARRIVVSERDTLDPLHLPNAFVSPSVFLWRSPSGGGTYSGLAVTDGLQLDSVGKRMRSESQLGLDLVTYPYGDPTDPHRPFLPRAALSRRTQSSNLVDPGTGVHSLTVSMGIEERVLDPYAPENPLVVNSLLTGGHGDDPAASADALGVGVTRDQLSSACHGRLTAFDQKVFAVLARTIRVSENFSMPGLNFASPTVAKVVTVFRGVGPHTYRANIYYSDHSCDDNGNCPFIIYAKVALEFVIDWTTGGRLRSGEARVLPQCPGAVAPGCSSYQDVLSAMFFLPPLWAGHEQQGEDVISAAPYLHVESQHDPSNVLSTTINWEELLANSGWN